MASAPFGSGAHAVSFVVCPRISILRSRETISIAATVASKLRRRFQETINR
jgi:hypothetical protein